MSRGLRGERKVAGLALRDLSAYGWRDWRRRWFCWEGGKPTVA
jgi:hypothetical protein